MLVPHTLYYEKIERLGSLETVIERIQLFR